MNAGRVAVGHPVDVGSGAVFTMAADFRIPGAVAINWRRHYSTVAAADAWLGPKWSVPYFMRLTREADRYVLSGAHGEEVSFPSVAEPLRAGAELTNLTASMELRREGGSVPRAGTGTPAGTSACSISTPSLRGPWRWRRSPTCPATGFEWSTTRGAGQHDSCRNQNSAWSR